MSGLAKELELAVSTISMVWYEGLAKTACDAEHLKVVRTRHEKMNKMERMLCSWVKDRVQ